MSELLGDLEAHLTERQRRAFALFWRDLNGWHGGSEGLVMGSIDDRIQLASAGRMWPPGGSYSVELNTLDQRLKLLRGHERNLMRRLVLSREMARGTLTDLGRLSSSYRTDKARKAVAVGRIAAFLDTLAEIYGIQGPLIAEV